MYKGKPFSEAAPLKDLDMNLEMTDQAVLNLYLEKKYWGKILERRISSLG